MNNPGKQGTYLLLAFEWTGLANAKPEKPQWFIRAWDGKHWETRRWQHDTGGYESLEPVEWQELPPVTRLVSTNDALLYWMRTYCGALESMVCLLRPTTDDPKTNVYTYEIDRLQHEISMVRAQLDNLP